jgi:ABC-type glutathione transport system ATPase component
MEINIKKEENKKALLNSKEKENQVNTDHVHIKQKKINERILLEWSNINYTIDLDNKKPNKKVAHMEIRNPQSQLTQENPTSTQERWSDHTSHVIDSNKIEIENENENNRLSNGYQSTSAEDQYSKSNKKIILNNIQGFALPNELLAIVGPSGCGKTSLLNIIASRQLPNDKKHHITRDVKFFFLNLFI